MIFDVIHFIYLLLYLLYYYIYIILWYNYKYIYPCNPLYFCTLSVISTQIYQQHRDISRRHTGNT